MAAEYYNYIDGEWTESDETFETANPAAPSETVATYHEADVDDATAAVEAASAAEDEWANTPAHSVGPSCARQQRFLRIEKTRLPTC